MINKNIILYPPGCYGTFFEWVFNFLENSHVSLPFSNNGSSNKFAGNFLFPPGVLFDHIDSNHSVRFSRTHPGIFEKVNQHENVYKDDYHIVLQEDVSFLEEHFEKILVITYDHQSILWLENNQLEKTLIKEEWFGSNFLPYGYTKDFLKDSMTNNPIERIRHTIQKEIDSVSSPLTLKNLQGWNKNTIYDFSIWELRELLSLFWFTRNQGQIAAWDKVKEMNTDVLHISISELRENFIKVIMNSANYFNISVDGHAIAKLEEMHRKWLPLQYQINKDSLCNKIVESLLTKEHFDWSNSTLSIIDEAWIQKKLCDNGVGIKCNNLNVFPTNTSDLAPLLERLYEKEIN